MDYLTRLTQQLKEKAMPKAKAKKAKRRAPRRTYSLAQVRRARALRKKGKSFNEIEQIMKLTKNNGMAAYRLVNRKVK